MCFMSIVSSVAQKIIGKDEIILGNCAFVSNRQYHGANWLIAISRKYKIRKKSILRAWLEMALPHCMSIIHVQYKQYGSAISRQWQITEYWTKQNWCEGLRRIILRQNAWPGAKRPSTWSSYNVLSRISLHCKSIHPKMPTK